MSDDVVCFEGVIEPLEWGRNTYTVMKVPDALTRAAAVARTRRVGGTVDGVEVNVGLNRADVIEGTFIYVGKPMMRRLDASVGDVVDCVLAPVDPDRVPVPDDVVDALKGGGLVDAFQGLPAPQRRQMLVPVEAAARPDTRAQRIRALLARLGSG